jgi:hypothetical protein
MLDSALVCCQLPLQVRVRWPRPQSGPCSQVIRYVRDILEASQVGVILTRWGNRMPSPHHKSTFSGGADCPQRWQLPNLLLSHRAIAHIINAKMVLASLLLIYFISSSWMICGLPFLANRAWTAQTAHPLGGPEIAPLACVRCALLC